MSASMRSANRAMAAALAPLLCGASEREIALRALGVVGRILFHRWAAPVSLRLLGAKEFGPALVEEIVDEIVADVARGTLLAVEKAPGQTLNLGAGYGVSIRRLVDVVLSQAGFKPSVVWDASKPSGDRKRIMDISRARAIGFEPAMTLDLGIAETMQWYRENRAQTDKRYDIFDSQATVRSTPSRKAVLGRRPNS